VLTFKTYVPSHEAGTNPIEGKNQQRKTIKKKYQGIKLVKEIQ